MATGQLPDEDEELRKKQSIMPKAVDFSRLFEQKEITLEDFENWKRQRDIKLKERLNRLEALESAVDPQEYIVGPGDGFIFNVWGVMELQVPINVSPEGKLVIPSAGEVDVAGRSLAEVRKLVQEFTSETYAHCQISLNLDVMRFFRVHVVGQVRFPGTYIAQAVNRISEMITEAGGITERAWKGGIVRRCPDGRETRFDLSAFEQTGDLSQDCFVNGGDVIYVPPIGLESSQVQVEADQENSGTYPIMPDEKLMTFLQRIRALKRNSDLTKIMVIRQKENGEEYLTPFEKTRTFNPDFMLESGDRIVLPSHYVYVKGAVRIPGAYPFVFNLTAKEYAGMAGGDFRSGNIKKVQVYHARTRKTEKGADVLVEPGDVVHVGLTFDQRFADYLRIISTMTSLILAAKAAGIFGE